MSAEPPPANTATTESTTQATESSPSEQPTDPKEVQAQADKLVGEGKKAIALKEWEEGVGKYAEALDLMSVILVAYSSTFASSLEVRIWSQWLMRFRRQLIGDFDPQMAPLLLSYGKALYELAYAQQGVMGNEELEKQAGDRGMPIFTSLSITRKLTWKAEPQTVKENAAECSSSNLVVSADPISDDEEEAQAGETSIAQTIPPDGEGEGEEEGNGEDEVDEPEDDYNAAWEVLDVARTIYAKRVEGLAEGEGREERLCLAECYLALGDVSCETGMALSLLM